MGQGKNLPEIPMPGLRNRDTYRGQTRSNGGDNPAALGVSHMGQLNLVPESGLGVGYGGMGHWCGPIEVGPIADGASSHNLAPPATPTFVVLRKSENKPPTAALRQFAAPYFRRT